MKKVIAFTILLVLSSASPVLAVDRGEVLGASTTSGQVLGATGIDLLPVVAIVLFLIILSTVTFFVVKKKTK